jgi:hypothetical protein
MAKTFSSRIAGVVVIVIAVALDAEAAVIALDSRETYLRTNADGGALDTVAIELVSLGLIAGDAVRLTQLGDFDCGPPCTDSNVGMIAVFSSTTALLAGSQAHRVPGALAAGTDFVTPVTFVGALLTDIPEDFAVLGTGVTVNIPIGATHLFIAARDILYHDNTDPDRDFGVRIEQVTVPEPALVLLLVPGLVALLRRPTRATG